NLQATGDGLAGRPRDAWKSTRRSVRDTGYDRLGTTGSSACEGCSRSTYTRLLATRLESARPSGSAVLGLTSKCGKLLLEMSIRIRCPRLNRLLVGNASMRTA